MPRISEIEDDGGDPTLKAVFDKQREIFGGLLNPTKVLAHCPPILKVAGLWAWRSSSRASYPRNWVPLIYTRVATINGCPF